MLTISIITYVFVLGIKFIIFMTKLAFMLIKAIFSIFIPFKK